MARKVKIRNLLSFSKAEFDIEPGPTLVTGANSSGKTSFARTLSALVAHADNPAGIKEKKAYLHGNEAEGLAEISEGAKWNGSKMAIPEGMNPETSRHAAGLIPLVPTSGMNERARARSFEVLFLPSDPEEILRDHWKGKKSKSTEERLMHIVRLINNEGWEAAEKNFGNLKRSEKRKWQDETGVPNYGAQIAAEWRPEGWESDLESVSEADLDAEVSDAQNALDVIARQITVTESQIEEAERLRDESLPPLKEQRIKLETQLKAENESLDKCRKQGEGARPQVEAERRTLADLQAKRNALANEKEPPKPDLMQCPKCNSALVAEGGELVAYDPEKYKAPDNAAKIAELSEKIKSQEGIVAEWESSFKEISDAYKAQNNVCAGLTTQYNEVVGQIKQVEAQIERFAGKEASERDEADRSVKEQALNRAKERRRVASQYRTATLIHENVIEYEWIEKLLSPTGARAKCMKEPMERVNAALSRVCEISGWDLIHVSEAYETFSNGRIARLCAENEQRKVQWALQIALALIEEDKWIILDAADLLRGEHWEGLVKVCDRLREITPDKYVVVCATETEAPDGWAKIELGEG